eukprot:m.60699 g.60699  ORF g.60699 m.60699 type:complete len:1359 (-) comp7043_c0_seq2:287-4363(-)
MALGIEELLVDQEQQQIDVDGARVEESHCRGVLVLQLQQLLQQQIHLRALQHGGGADLEDALDARRDNLDGDEAQLCVGHVVDRDEHALLLEARGRVLDAAALDPRVLDDRLRLVAAKQPGKALVARAGLAHVLHTVVDVAVVLADRRRVQLLLPPQLSQRLCNLGKLLLALLAVLTLVANVLGDSIEQVLVVVLLLALALTRQLLDVDEALRLQLRQGREGLCLGNRPVAILLLGLLVVLLALVNGRFVRLFLLLGGLAGQQLRKRLAAAEPDQVDDHALRADEERLDTRVLLLGHLELVDKGQGHVHLVRRVLGRVWEPELGALVDRLAEISQYNAQRILRGGRKGLDVCMHHPVDPVHVVVRDDDGGARQQHDLRVLVDVEMLLQRRHLGRLEEEHAEPRPAALDELVDGGLDAVIVLAGGGDLQNLCNLGKPLAGLVVDLDLDVALRRDQRGVDVAVVQQVAQRLDDVILSLTCEALTQRDVHLAAEHAQTVRQVLGGPNNARQQVVAEGNDALRQLLHGLTHGGVLERRLARHLKRQCALLTGRQLLPTAPRLVDLDGINVEIKVLLLDELLDERAKHLRKVVAAALTAVMSHDETDHRRVAGRELLDGVVALADLVLKRRTEKLEHQVLLTRVAGKVVDGLGQAQQEGLGFVRTPGLERLLDEDQAGEVERLGLQEVEQGLVRLKLVAGILVECVDTGCGDGQRGLRAGALLALEQARLLDDILEVDAVLDEQADLDVHLVQVRLQLVALLDLQHDLLLELLQLQLLGKIGVALVQQVQEPPHRRDGRVADLCEVLVLAAGAEALPCGLDADNGGQVVAEVLQPRLVAPPLQHAPHVRLDLEDGRELVVQEGHARAEGDAGKMAADVRLQADDHVRVRGQLVPPTAVGIGLVDRGLDLLEGHDHLLDGGNPLSNVCLLIEVVRPAGVRRVLAPLRGAGALRLQGGQRLGKVVQVAALVGRHDVADVAVRILQRSQGAVGVLLADSLMQRKDGGRVVGVLLGDRVDSRDTRLHVRDVKIGALLLARDLQLRVVLERARIVHVRERKRRALHGGHGRLGILTLHRRIQLGQRGTQGLGSLVLGVGLGNRLLHRRRGQLALGQRGREGSQVRVLCRGVDVQVERRGLQRSQQGVSIARLHRLRDAVQGAGLETAAVHVADGGLDALLGQPVQQPLQLREVVRAGRVVDPRDAGGCNPKRVQQLLDVPSRDCGLDLLQRSVDRLLLAKLLGQHAADAAEGRHLHARRLQLGIHLVDLFLGELGDAVQVLDLGPDAQLEQIAAERVDAVDNARHVLLVVEVRDLGVEDLGEPDAAHRLRPACDVVRVAEGQPTLLVHLLVNVINLALLDLVRGKEKR